MWYTALIELFTKLGNLLLDEYNKRRISKKVEEKQHERDKLENDPADWFNDHFGGVRGNTTEAADVRGPGEANSAKTDGDSEPRR